MNDLPDPATQQNSKTQNPNTKQEDTQNSGVGLGAKETEPSNVIPEGLRDATGQETQLSPEVSGAGVRVHPTSVSIPPSVASLGVKPAGQNVPVTTTSTVVLPLTDDQIAVGLHQSISNSVRWLAAWCIRRLKQVHIVLKNVHGKLIRIKG
jgi:hypothetical protein